MIDLNVCIHFYFITPYSLLFILSYFLLLYLFFLFLSFSFLSSFSFLLFPFFSFPIPPFPHPYSFRFSLYFCSSAPAVRYLALRLLLGFKVFFTSFFFFLSSLLLLLYTLQPLSCLSLAPPSCPCTLSIISFLCSSLTCLFAAYNVFLLLSKILFAPLLTCMISALKPSFSTVSTQA